MIVKKRRVTVALIVLAAIAAAALCASLWMFETVYASGFTAETELNSEYNVGETVDIPAGTFTFGDGTEVPASVTVERPDGSELAVASITLDRAGIYTVKYSASHAGEVMLHDVQIMAVSPLYSAGPKSVLSYGTDESAWNTGRSGIRVRLAKDEVFTFNEVIDVSEPSIPIARISVTPDAIGSVEASALYFRLTDPADSENYIEVDIKISTGVQQYTYIMARANGQLFCGRQYYGNTTIHVNNAYGHPIGWTPVSAATEMVFFYDPVENALYHASIHEANMIVDFDSLEWPNDPWNGFSSNYVIFSMYADGYTGDYFNALISALGSNDLDGDILVDTQGPEITVESYGMDIYSGLPEGIVGKQYELFEASAADAYAQSEIKVTRRVFFGYARTAGIYDEPSNNFLHELDTYGGVFTPSIPGNYAIVYSAYDTFGNYTEVVSVVTVAADTGESGIYLSLEPGYANEAETGNRVYIASVAEYGGFAGRARLSYSVTYENGEVVLYGGDIAGRYFIPSQAGSYTVTIEVTDTVGSVDYEEYTVTVSSPTAPSFENEPVLPRYFIRGSEYTLPALSGVDLRSGETVAAEITIADGAGERAGSGKVFFVPDANGNAVITYSAGTNRISYTIPVITVYDDEYPDCIAPAKYFVTESAGTRMDKDERGVILSVRSGNGSAEFANSLLASNFIVNLRVDPAYNQFDSFTLTLTDSADAEKSVDVTFVNSYSAGEDTQIFVNGTYVSTGVGSLFFSGSTLSLRYNASMQALTDGTSLVIPLQTTAGNEVFNGFSGNIYASFSISGAATRSNLIISRLNNQTLSDSIISDTVRPEVVLSDTYAERVFALGDLIEVYSAAASDVLGQIDFAAVSVTYGENNIPVAANDGRVLTDVPIYDSYTFVADRYGNYTITYTVIDSNGRSVTSAYMLEIVDKTGPVITLSDYVAETGKTGEWLVLPSAVATDEIDGQVDVYLAVIYPDYTSRKADENNAVPLTMPGTYIVRYRAMDASGNTTNFDFTVEVTD